MIVLVSGGEKTQNIVSVLERKFGHTGVQFLVIKNIEDIEEIYGKGQYFDRALICEQSWTHDGKIKDESEIRKKICNFSVSASIHNEIGTAYVLLTSSNYMAEIVHEELLPIGKDSAVVVKAAPYSIGFFANLVSNDLEKLGDDILFKPVTEVEIEEVGLFDSTVEKAESNKEEEEYNFVENTDFQKALLGREDSGNAKGLKLEKGEYKEIKDLRKEKEAVEEVIEDEEELEVVLEDDEEELLVVEEDEEIEDEEAGVLPDYSEEEEELIVEEEEELVVEEDVEEYIDKDKEKLEELLEADEDIFDMDESILEKENEPAGELPDYSIDEPLEEEEEQLEEEEDDFEEEELAVEEEEDTYMVISEEDEEEEELVVEDDEQYEIEEESLEVEEEDSDSFENYDFNIIEDGFNSDTVENKVQGEKVMGTGNVRETSKKISSSSGGGTVSMDMRTFKQSLDVFAQRGNIMVVTGCNGAGITSIGFNIANTLNRLGYKTLFVDCDTEIKSGSYMNKECYEAMEVTDCHVKSAFNSGNLSENVAIVRKGFHVIADGIAVDSYKFEKDVHRNKLVPFIVKARANYHFIVLSMNSELAYNYCSEITYMCDDLIYLTNTTQYGLTQMLVTTCNIEDDGMQRFIFQKAEVIYNRYGELDMLYGKPIKKFTDIGRVMDIYLESLVGEAAGDLSFNKMKKVGYIPRVGNKMDRGMFTGNCWADTEDGRRIMFEIIKSILIK